MVKSKVYIYTKAFEGLPKEGDLVIKEEDLPPLQVGEFLAEAVYLSVDPYMRAYAPRIPLGVPYIGSQVAKILESKNPDYPVGRHVVAYFGWRSHTISNGKPLSLGIFSTPAPILIPDVDDVSLSYFLGVLGMPGNTAYFGFLEICQPQKGETVVVSGAAGAVGSIVGQIAKIKGCTVIGIAGSEEKGKWIVDELGFDHFINYKTADLDKALSQVAPKGVDCYFDNVGGDTTITVIKHMNELGRISVCGAISSYNENDGRVLFDMFTLVAKQIKMEGFLVHRWNHRYSEGVQQNLKWIKEGKLKCRETVTEGFENMLKAFVEMLQGDRKSVV